MDRLERALQASDRLVGPSASELVDALQSAQQDNARLHETVDSVSVRLDSAIGRLRTVLGS